LELQLTFDSPLSEAGLTRTVGGFEDWTYYVGSSRSVTGGQVVAIPEPAALVCICVCFALLAGFSSHRRDFRNEIGSLISINEMDGNQPI
jgi:hypothetical protein